jgi:hypothetical protein
VRGRLELDGDELEVLQEVVAAALSGEELELTERQGRILEHLGHELGLKPVADGDDE